MLPCLFLAAFLAQFPVPSKAQDPQGGTLAADAAAKDEDAAEAARNARLRQALGLIGENRHDEAVRDVLDPLIAEFEAKYADAETRIYCPTTPAEALVYMAGVAADADRGVSEYKRAVAVSPTWAFAYYYKAYALLDLDRVDQARPFLEKALSLAPMNPLFLSELGHMRRMRTDWEGSLQAYADSLAATEIGSTDAGRKLDQARAMRGQGYALIELGRLDEAKAKYRKSLKLDPGSSIAKDELDYIKQLKNKK
jgi:Flp pilus assembly protein TadD